MNAAGLLDALALVVGTDALFAAPADLERYALDGRDARCLPLAVVRPRTVDEVATVVSLAVEAGVRLVPQGGRTGLVGAGVGDGATLILSLERLASAPSIDVVNRTARVDAGVALSALNASAAPHGLFFPIDLGADPSIGGMIASNTGGARFLRYGDVRRNLLALDVVTVEPRPQRMSMGADLWKNNVGLDLKQIFVGSAGSLAVVTGATLALAPCPAVSVTAMLALSEPDHATALLICLEAEFGTLLTAFEGLSGAAIDAATRHVARLRHPFACRTPGYAVLIELSAGRALDADMLETALAAALRRAIEDGTIEDVVVDRGRDLWAVRHAVPEGLRAAGRVVACDIALRRGDVMRFRREMTERLHAIAPALLPHDFGHVGDGGLHFNLVWPTSAGPFDPVAAETARATVYRTVVEDFGGSFSAEHGIGPANARWYRHFVPRGTRRLSGAIQRLIAPTAVGRVDFEDPVAGARA